MTAQSLPSENLAGAFAKPDRAGQIKLPASKAPSPQKRPTAPQRAAEAPEAPPATPRRAAPAAAPKRHILVLWCPESIRARMRAVRAQKGTTYLNQVLDAIEATVDELPQLVERTRPQPTKGRLFERTTPETPGDAEVKVQLTIRGVLQSHLDVMDQLVTETGAPNRSALICIALDHALPVRPRAMR